MKGRTASILYCATLAACTAGSAAWTSDVCGCAPAWASLRNSFQLPVSAVAKADDFTLQKVQLAAQGLVGHTVAIADLPDTGSGSSCHAVPAGALCEWNLWYRGSQAKGY